MDLTSAKHDTPDYDIKEIGNMRFMICDKDTYHEIPTPAHNPYEDKYVAIMHNYGLTTGVWYPCELISTLPCPDMTVWAYDIQLSNTRKYIRVLKSEIDNGYVKLDFEEGDKSGQNDPCDQTE